MKYILTRPVAPQQASRASSTTIFKSFARASSLRNLATETPDIPVPMIAISAELGSSAVVLWPNRNFDGSLCQKDAVGLALGRREGLFSAPMAMMIFQKER